MNACLRRLVLIGINHLRHLSSLLTSVKVEVKKQQVFMTCPATPPSAIQCMCSPIYCLEQTRMVATIRIVAVTLQCSLNIQLSIDRVWVVNLLTKGTTPSKVFSMFGFGGCNKFYNNTECFFFALHLYIVNLLTTVYQRLLSTSLFQLLWFYTFSRKLPTLSCTSCK